MNRHVAEWYAVIAFMVIVVAISLVVLVFSG